MSCFIKEGRGVRVKYYHRSCTNVDVVVCLRCLAVQSGVLVSRWNFRLPRGASGDDDMPSTLTSLRGWLPGSSTLGDVTVAFRPLASRRVHVVHVISTQLQVLLCQPASPELAASSSRSFAVTTDVVHVPWSVCVCLSVCEPCKNG